MLSVNVQRLLAVVSVALVYLGPLALARPQERLLNLIPFTLVVTAPAVLLLTVPFLAATVLILRARLSRWPPRSVWAIPFGVAIVGTLPGMVGVHRSFLAWHSYLDHLPWSLICLVFIATFTVARATLRPQRRSACSAQALIAASAVNAAFPWWPLD